MTNQEASIVERLSKAESPCDFKDWEGRDGYYITACRASIEDVPHLISIAGKWSDPDWPDCQDEIDDGPDMDMLPVTAWRTLADLKSSESVEPLIDMLCELDEDFEDWTSSELPHVFGKIGQPAIETLVRVAKDADKRSFVRSIAASGLRWVAGYNAETRDRIVACLAEMMVNAAKDNIEFNTELLIGLVELQAVEAAEPIERAFANDLLDVGMMGNWEVVRRELGVEGLRLKMPANPYNSIEQFRTRMGIGIFSNQSIFESGEINPDAQQAYYDRAWDVFSKSDEAQQVLDCDDDLGWFRMLLEFGLDYLGETVDAMTVETISEFVFDYIPRKVSTESELADSAIFELTMFWEYLDRVFELPEAKSIVEWLKADGIVAKLEAELSDPSNFCMAKSIVMSGINAGFDMTSEAGMAGFITAYNQSLQQPESVPAPVPTPVPTITRGERVGRNDPCPCGSGKKYKKCCR